MLIFHNAFQEFHKIIQTVDRQRDKQSAYYNN